MTQYSDRKSTNIILSTAIVPCLVLLGVLFFNWLAEKKVLFPDFFGIWSFGKFILTHSPASIYDNGQLYSFQASLGMPVESGAYPFPYPPWILLLLVPIGSLPYPYARIIWLIVTFGAYAISLGLWRWPRLPAILLVLAPSSIICFVVGQNGFLTAALMLGGIKLLRSHPVIAGSLLATLAYKPQIAVLIPFLLMFGLHWRALVSALCTACILSIATIIAFGQDIWLVWVKNVLGEVSSLAAARGDMLDMMPTLTAAALLSGSRPALAYLVQFTGVVVSIAALWAVRRRTDGASLAILPLGSIVATPYAFHYDLPMATGAVLSVLATKIYSEARLSPFELSAILACVLLPVLLIARVTTMTVLVPATLLVTLCILAFTEPQS